MDVYQHYVYTYSDPDGTVVYVGHGSKGRAWQCGNKKGEGERCDWKEAQIRAGRLPIDWVTLVYRGLTKSEACGKEKELIAKHVPILNRQSNPDYTPPRMYSEHLEDMLRLRSEGLSYKKIATLFNIPEAMSVWRCINDNR